LVAKKYTARIGEIGRRARKIHRKLTLPWDDDGSRLLPVQAYWDYMGAIRPIKAEYQAAALELRDAWDEAMDEARQRLSSMFNEDDYRFSKESLFCVHPDTNELLRFVIKTRMKPLSEGADFRVAIADDEQQRIRDEINREYRDAIHEAVDGMWSKIREPIEKLSDSMRRYDETDEVKTIQTAWFNNLREAIEIVPKLNITGDPRLDEIARNAQALLLQWNVDQLKVSPSTRKFIVTAADELLSQMAGYTGTAAGGLAAAA
jgi:hypothetical protein